MKQAAIWLFWFAVVTAAVLVTGPDVARAAGQPPNDYTNPDTWLCRPGRDGPCTVPVTSTVIGPDGKLTRETSNPNPNAPVDCFYVYPTVSRQLKPNADMVAGPEQKEIARQQVAPFASKCRIYAPLYRQLTLAALKAEAAGDFSKIDPVLGPSDVVDAWNTYLAHDNGGRGVVLIGHSQGAAILKQIIEVLIDRSPLAVRLISAIIPGTDVDVLQGKDVGGTFATIPLCRAATQTGCVISYSSFLDSRPPGNDARFGMASRPAMSDGCVNPALLDTGRPRLDSSLPANADDMARLPFDTQSFKVPGLLTAACVSMAKHTYLAISVGNDQRASLVSQVLGYFGRDPSWGLHDLDIGLAIGNLVDVVGIQARTWIARNGSNIEAR